jgi:protein BCP1
MAQHRKEPVIQQLTAYLASRAASVEPRLAPLKALLAPDSKAQVGLVLMEHLINMPHQVVPPMYTMLQEELAWALEEKEPYEFTHYLIVSKTYTLVDSKLDAEDNPPSKKKKAAAASSGPDAEINYFHVEDEVWQRHALAYGGYDFEKVGDEGASDARRAFQEEGIRPQGLAILIEAGKFAGAIEAVGEYLGGE